MNGEQLLPVSRERVWAALNDPDVIRDCVPGCESLERVSETEFQARLTAAIGPVKAKFTGKLLLSDLDPPGAYRIAFEGSGGAAGFAKGDAQVSLFTVEAGTRLVYTAKVQVGGKLAQVGSRLIDGVAAKIAGEFFARFEERLGGRPTPVPAGQGERPAGAPLFRRAAVLAAIVAAAAIAWWLFR